jgi:hypothetical protein
MDPIWTQLPYDLVHRILEFSDEIDTRIYFKIPPRKLLVDKNFQFRSEFVYDNFSKIMFDFSGMNDPVDPYWVIRKGIKFSQYRSPSEIYIFNMGWEDYEMTMFSDAFQMGPSTCSNHIVIYKRVKFV